MKEKSTSTTTSHTLTEKARLNPQLKTPTTPESEEFLKGQLSAYLEVLSAIHADQPDLWERITFTLPQARKLVFKDILYLRGKVYRLERQLSVAAVLKKLTPPQSEEEL